MDFYETQGCVQVGFVFIGLRITYVARWDKALSRVSKFKEAINTLHNITIYHARIQAEAFRISNVSIAEEARKTLVISIYFLPAVECSSKTPMTNGIRKTPAAKRTNSEKQILP